MILPEINTSHLEVISNGLSYYVEIQLIEKIVENINLRRIPHASPGQLGLMRYKERIVSVLNPFGTSDGEYLLILKHNKELIALSFDRIGKTENEYEIDKNDIFEVKTLFNVEAA